MKYLSYDFQDEAVRASLLKKNSIGRIILPTGTGKSRIQARIIEKMIRKNPGFGVYMIVTPRILLTNQLMTETAKHLLKKKISFKRMIIHSGRFNEDEILGEVGDDPTQSEIELMKLMSEYDSEITTSSARLKDGIEKARRLRVPVVVSSTYHSMESAYRAIKAAGLTFDLVLCDEAHYLVGEDFFASAEKVWEYAEKMFFFTATQKFTSSDVGRGMNNEEFFGPVLCWRSPRRMIEEGYIVPPRLHLLDVENTEKEAVARAIVEGFDEHRKLAGENAKLLVACKGQEQLAEIIRSTTWKGFIYREARNETNFKYFDITSAFGSNIDGLSTKREDFLKELRQHSGPAIVLHVNILTEGIDVTDMSGIMPLSNMKKGKFLQTLGRATRLHPTDRAAFQKGTYAPQNYKKMRKPFAYVIVPTFEDDGDDRNAFIKELIASMRDHGFEPSEDVIVRQNAGVPEPEPIDLTTEPTKGAKGKSLFNALFAVHYMIESEKVAAIMNSRSIETYKEYTKQIFANVLS